ncbi:MAG: PAS domain-containing protein [Cyanobacteria bacterium J06639_14]
MDEATELNANFFVVGIGASAGGLRSLEEFFENMPTDSGAAFVVIQHLSPTHKSMMHELLERYTSMAIYPVEDTMALAPDSIYLIPPGMNMVVRDRILYLSAQDRHQGRIQPHYPIDIFFESLAQDCQTHAMGVVLSGTGSDGSQGLMTLHEQGGIAMVQDPTTAEFDGMPQSALLTGVVDRVLAPRDLACSIHQLIHLSLRMSPRDALDMGNRLQTDVATNHLQRIAQILSTDGRLDFSLYRPSTLSRRIQRRCLVTGFHDFDAYIQHLEQSATEQFHLRNDLLINVTRFFRNREAWDYLETTVIPQIFQQARPGELLRFWVTACSTGEEAYSLAILLDEARQRINQSLQLKIFATDIDEVALGQASVGQYTQNIIKDLSAARLQQYFIANEQGYQVNRSLRQLLIFSTHNLIQDAMFTNMHFVSCRNILIYLQPSLQQKVCQSLHFALKVQGILFMGESESLGPLENEFAPLNRKWNIYRKQRDVKLSVASTGKRDPLRAMPYSPVSQASTAEFQFEPLMSSIAKRILEHYQTTCFVVAADHTLRHVVADPLKLLQVPDGKITNQITSMLPAALHIPLNTALHRAKQVWETIEFKDIPLSVANQTQYVQVRVTQQSQGEMSRLLIIEIQGQTETYRPQVETLHEAADTAVAAYVRQLENELQLTRQNLQTTIEELETTNEEQQASNEELIASNEELQSTNEELQSVNEELHTLNAEYHSNNHQLTELNTDLDNLLQSTQIGVIFLDAALKIRRFTKAITHVIPVLDSDIGRSLNDLSWRIEGLDLIDLIRQVNRQKETLEREVKHRDTGQYLLLRIYPYRSAPQVYDGTVITIVDIDRLKQAETQAREAAAGLQQANELLEQRVAERTADLQASEERFMLAVQGSGTGIFDWNVRTNEIYLSPRCKQIMGCQDHELPGTFEDWTTYIHPDDQERVLEAIQTHLQQRLPYDIEYRLRTQAGDYCWVHAKAQALWDETGNPMRMAGSIMDISDRKQAEVALKASEERYALVVQGVGGGIWDWNILTDDNVMSSRFKQILGYEDPEMHDLLKEWEDRVHPDDLERVWELHNNHLQHRTPYEAEYRMRTKTGDYVWIRDTAQALWDDAGNPIRMSGSVIDISDRKQAEAQLHESEARYRQLYQSTPALLHSINAAGEIISVSDLWLSTFGYERSEVIGRQSTEFLTPESHQYAVEVVLPEYFKTGMCLNVPYQWVCKDGSIRDVLLSATSEHDESGTFVRSLAILVDVSHLNPSPTMQASRDLGDIAE